MKLLEVSKFPCRRWESTFGAVEPTMGLEVTTVQAHTSRPRLSLARLAGRIIWIVADLALGYFVLFNACFLSVLAFYEEDFEQPIVFGLIASVVLIGLAVAMIALLNIGLRLFNRDMSVRMFWWVTSALCVIGAAADLLVHPYLL